jgi:hypothetical protein
MVFAFAADSTMTMFICDPVMVICARVPNAQNAVCRSAPASVETARRLEIACLTKGKEDTSCQIEIAVDENRVAVCNRNGYLPTVAEFFGITWPGPGLTE